MTDKDIDTPEFNNQCGMCSHKQNPDAGHCYMFRMKPVGPCGQHTVPTIRAMHTRVQACIATMERMHEESCFGDERYYAND